MKRLIKNFDNLPADVRVSFRHFYQEGIEESVMRITKPDGTSLFVVPFQTDDTHYLVKISSLQNSEEEHILEDEFLFNDSDELPEAPQPDDEIMI